MNLSKTYNPDDFESNIYALWESRGAFASGGNGEPFSVIMPPPNANGNLHLGHALTIAVEDIMIRYYRMRGRDTVYIPGADHAGFETWVVFEKELQKQGKSRFNFSREEIYSQVWNYVDKQRGNMELQLRALGASASWKDSVFTLDKKVIDVVYDTFEQMMKDGLVYRGERIVNYSTAYQTSYADIEVDYKTEVGTLWNIAYPLVDRVGEIIVATTRPETMFGDVAVAVHPDDERYKYLIGKKVQLPLTEREIPIISDEYVDRTYGTGAVKITPAHDVNDFELGKRHKLDRVQVIGFDGKMINVPDNFLGLDVDVARKRVVAALEANELLRGETSITHNVGYDYKSGLPIQPLIKDQWFIKVKSLADKAKEAIENGQISITPAGKKRILIQYLDNLRDWNLSRQIPWGIPIPAFQNVNDSNDWIFDRRVDQKTIDVGGNTYVREEDTFDTWFSSGQWPFITTNALDKNDPLSKFYPNSVMETGLDLIDRWVARMIMLGIYKMGEIPFKHIYFHGLVLDEKGQKMSKSKNNVINPMELISSHGSDALRIGIISSRSAGQNQAFSLSKVTAGRNFANKLWNVARFIENQTGEEFVYKKPEPNTIADHWIVKQLNEASRVIADNIEKYRFAEACEVMYHSVWNSVADWYVESAKFQINPNMLAWVLETCLKISHPFAPFVSEAIWQSLPWRNDMLIKSSWPTEIEFDEISASEFERLIDLVTEVRRVVSELPKSQKYQLLYVSNSMIEENALLIKSLTKLRGVVKTDNSEGLKLANSGQEVWLDVNEKTLKEHHSNISRRIDEAKKTLQNLEARLANPSYVEKAPQALVAETQKELGIQKELIQALSVELNLIGQLD